MNNISMHDWRGLSENVNALNEAKEDKKIDIQKFKNFMKTHWRKIAIGIGIIGISSGAYILLRSKTNSNIPDSIVTLKPTTNDSPLMTDIKKDISKTPMDNDTKLETIKTVMDIENSKIEIIRSDKKLKTMTKAKLDDKFRKENKYKLSDNEIEKLINSKLKAGKDKLFSAKVSKMTNEIDKLSKQIDPEGETILSKPDKMKIIKKMKMDWSELTVSDKVTLDTLQTKKQVKEYLTIIKNISF